MAGPFPPLLRKGLWGSNERRERTELRISASGSICQVKEKENNGRNEDLESGPMSGE